MCVKQHGPAHTLSPEQQLQHLPGWPQGRGRTTCRQPPRQSATCWPAQHQRTHAQPTACTLLLRNTTSQSAARADCAATWHVAYACTLQASVQAESRTPNSPAPLPAMPVPALTWCGISRMFTMGIVNRLKPGVWESPKPSVSLAAAVSSRLKSSATRRLREPALRSQRSLPLKHQHSRRDQWLQSACCCKP